MASEAAKASVAGPEPATAPPSPDAAGTHGRAPSYEEVAARAYFIAMEEGGGDEVTNWLRAERELATA
ncbi:MAG: DUF2934 domain-containing protein [Solirubrobacteraceae bacterium]